MYMMREMTGDGVIGRLMTMMGDTTAVTRLPAWAKGYSWGSATRTQAARRPAGYSRCRRPCAQLSRRENGSTAEIGDGVVVYDNGIKFGLARLSKDGVTTRLLCGTVRAEPTLCVPSPSAGGGTAEVLQSHDQSFDDSSFIDFVAHNDSSEIPLYVIDIDDKRKFTGLIRTAFSTSLACRQTFRNSRFVKTRISLASRLYLEGVIGNLPTNSWDIPMALSGTTIGII
ncbi:hypothetical protein H4582DRAFT_2064341 [Lactarius indigo]|nr:hypothetical protein H4582DRAFT_2064341 [Lactarius indigo]